MRGLFRAVGFAFILFLPGGLTQAGSITFTQEFTGVSGSIGGTSFSNETVTFTATADTTNITGSYNLVLDTINYTLTGSVSGSGFLTHPGYVFVNQAVTLAGIGGRAGVSVGDFGDVSDPAFGSYQLTTSIGPITNSNFGSDGSAADTNNGLLSLDTVSDVTFSSVAASATVPEPSTLAMLGTAIVATTSYMVRRRKACMA